MNKSESPLKTRVISEPSSEICKLIYIIILTLLPPGKNSFKFKKFEGASSNPARANEFLVGGSSVRMKI